VVVRRVRGSGLSPFAQDVLLGTVAALAAPRLVLRRRPLPPRGQPTYVTTVLRLPSFTLPPLDLPERHHRYPPGTIHVTVANVDRARVPIADAVATLRAQPLPVARIALNGLGVSPDTVFVRCVADSGFATLRLAVAEAFGQALPRSPLYRWTAWANVVRFDGRGTRVAADEPTGWVEAAVLEVVRTDRYLSDEGTEVLATVPLGHQHPGELSR
jgi:hypothetical protein